jgi:hypothetical protein
VVIPPPSYQFNRMIATMAAEVSAALAINVGRAIELRCRRTSKPVTAPMIAAAGEVKIDQPTPAIGKMLDPPTSGTMKLAEAAQHAWISTLMRIQFGCAALLADN